MWKLTFPMCMDFGLVFTLGDPSHISSVVLLALVKVQARTVLMAGDFYRISSFTRRLSGVSL